MDRSCFSIVLAAAFSAACNSGSGLRPATPDVSLKPACPPQEISVNTKSVPVQSTRAGLSLFFTPATFDAGKMETSVRIENNGIAPLVIQSLEIVEVLVDVPRPSPEEPVIRTSGDAHFLPDHGASKLAAGEPDAWSFELPFHCAPFLRLKLRVTALNEATGGTDVITLVTGVDAYKGCPQGWEKNW